MPFGGHVGLATQSCPLPVWHVGSPIQLRHSSLDRCGDHSPATQGTGLPGLRVAAAARTGAIEVRTAPAHRGAVRRQPALGTRRRLRRRQLRLPDGCREDRRDAALVPGNRHRDGDRLPAVDREPAARSGRAGLAHRDHHRRRRGDLRAGQPVERAHGRRPRADRRGAGAAAARGGRGPQRTATVASTSTSRSATAAARRSPTPCARCWARNSPTAPAASS